MTSSIVWFLILGALFYFMMRGGGCGMHSHGGHEGHEGHESEGHGGGAGPSAPASVRDPVCGMEIEGTAAAGTTRHDGRTWYFCSEACQAKFLGDPGLYAG